MFLIIHNNTGAVYLCWAPGKIKGVPDTNVRDHLISKLGQPLNCDDATWAFITTP